MRHDPPITVRTAGDGPPVLLIHGGASPRTTWDPLTPLGSRWRLLVMHRRGYPPGPSELGDGHDFDVDAADIAGLLTGRPHVVAHSYGALGAAIAVSTCTPTGALSDAHRAGPLQPCSRRPRGRPIRTDRQRGPHPRSRNRTREATRVPADRGSQRRHRRAASGLCRQRGSPSPSQSASRRCRDRSWCNSEGEDPHAGRLRRPQRCDERICAAASRQLDGEHLVFPGAGHFAMRAVGFNESLGRFLAHAEARRG